MIITKKQFKHKFEVDIENNKIKQKSFVKYLGIFRGARRNFFRWGGKRSIHYLLDEIKRHSCNQDFAKGLEPIAKMILFKRCCNLGGMLSKLMQFKCFMDGGLGAKPSVARRFSQFL